MTLLREALLNLNDWLSKQTVRRMVKNGRVPRDIYQAMEFVEYILSDELRDEVLAMPECYLGFGARQTLQIIRALWLVQPRSALVRHFSKVGIHDPEDMAMIILKSFHRRHNRQPIELALQAYALRDRWRRQGVNPDYPVAYAGA